MPLDVPFDMDSPLWDLQSTNLNGCSLAVHKIALVIIASILNTHVVVFVHVPRLPFCFLILICGNQTSSRCRACINVLLKTSAVSFNGFQISFGLDARWPMVTVLGGKFLSFLGSIATSAVAGDPVPFLTCASCSGYARRV